MKRVGGRDIYRRISIKQVYDLKNRHLSQRLGNVCRIAIERKDNRNRASYLTATLFGREKLPAATLPLYLLNFMLLTETYRDIKSRAAIKKQ